MSKESDEQLQTTNTHKVADHRVADAGDETDSKAANKASNAALKKEAAKKASHDVADQVSETTAEQGLADLALHFGLWSQNLTDAKKGDVHGDGGFAAVADGVTHVGDVVLKNMDRVGRLVATTDASRKRFLLPNALKAKAAYEAFKPFVTSANQFLANNGSAKHIQDSTMQSHIDEYLLATTGGDQTISTDTKDLKIPTGDPKGSNQATIAQYIKSLAADVDSVEKGNANLDGARIGVHVLGLKQLIKDSPTPVDLKDVRPLKDRLDRLNQNGVTKHRFDDAMRDLHEFVK